MSKVGILTDSIHGLSPELIEQYDIRVAPMCVNIDNKGYRDGVDIKPQDFYKLFKQMESPGTTSAATPGDFLSIFKSLSGVTDSMVYIGVSGILTATFNVAQQTRNMFVEDHPDIKIELIDSKNCMGALGFLVLEAARSAEAGKSLPEITAMVQNMMPRVKYVSVLDTLRYLIKIGRISRTVASEEKLKFRPLIGMTDNSGKMENFPAAEISRALEKLIELAQQHITPGKPLHAIVHHSEYTEEAEELKEMIISKFNPIEFYMTEYSPAALLSTGLMTGLSFYT
jgi:DegV family protein with EDD domain